MGAPINDDKSKNIHSYIFEYYRFSVMVRVVVVNGST